PAFHSTISFKQPRLPKQLSATSKARKWKPFAARKNFLRPAAPGSFARCTRKQLARPFATNSSALDIRLNPSTPLTCLRCLRAGRRTGRNTGEDKYLARRPTHRK